MWFSVVKASDHGEWLSASVFENLITQVIGFDSPPNLSDLIFINLWKG